MAKVATKKPSRRGLRAIKKPTLVMCGKHFIDINDVSAIKEVHLRRTEEREAKKLFVVKLKSEPNPEFPIWLKDEEAAALLLHFNIEG